MMQQADRQRLTHIYEYCVSIEKAIQHFGSDFQSFDSDEDFQHSLSFCLLQNGELGGGLSEEYRRDSQPCAVGADESRAKYGCPRLWQNGSPDYLGDSDDGYSRVKGFLRGTIEHLRLFCNTENRNVFSTRGRHRQEMISLNEQYVYQCCDFGCNLSMYLVD